MTSRNQHEFNDFIVDEWWYHVEARMKTKEGREELRIKDDKFGRLPLLTAIEYGAPLELLEAMLEQYPEAVEMTDNNGRLPLHSCYFYKCRPQVVRLILNAYPEGVRATTRFGWLPLHIAAENNVPLEILRMLMDAHPEGAATRGQDGLLPVHHLTRSPSEASTNKKEDAKKVELLLRPLINNEMACLAPNPDTSWTPLHIGAKFDLLSLHSCLRIRRCPAEVISEVANRHPEQLRETDEDGNLPLHLAAANPNLNGARDGREDIIVKMVRLYPDAAAASNGEGRSPLNLAIESGKQWKEGVEAISDAAMGVMTIRDVGTNLFPFMLAASGANPCITTIYKLLRCCPEKCKKP